MKPKLTPESLRQIFLELQAANVNAVVVGGQAVNLWSSQYAHRSPQLMQLLPFASEDLDFYGGRLEVINCRDALQGKAKLNQDFDPSPNSGLVMVKRQNFDLRIDFLASVYGLNDTEIESTALTFSGQEELTGIQLRVLHPVLCLEGKLRALRGLPQQGRQDLKHVKMSILFVREFLLDLCQQAAARSGLKLVERVIGSSLREDGLSAWYRYGIQVETAVPLYEIATMAEEKWQRFCEQRLPQIMTQINSKRQQYQALMHRTTAREVTTPRENETFSNSIKATPQVEQQLGAVEASNTELRNLTAVISARRLLTTLGQATYENEHYCLSLLEDNITITAKDGRGAIAQSQFGKVVGNVSPQDIEQLTQLERTVASANKAQSQRSQLNFDQEIGE